MSSTHSVRIEPLSKDNFDTWKLQVKALLVKNDAWEFVNGEKTKPELVEGEEAGASILARNQWDIADR